ncbi:MAG: PA14 domain-containing protein [Chryseosolibacter sp.]
MKTIIGCAVLLLTCQATFSQVDTSFIYRTNTPYGTLDLRLAKSATRFYYLQEDKTFSFRESAPGVRTETYRDMTSWDSSPYKQGNLREKNGQYDNFVLNYRLLFPTNHNPTYAQGYPMIVMMHGAGERGNCWDNNCFWDTRGWKPASNTPPAPRTADHQLLNNDYNLLHGGMEHLQARNLAGNRLPDDPGVPARAFPGFVLFPQNLNGWDGSNVQDAIKLIRLLSKKYNIDPNRIYVHGLSNGGIATYEVIKRAPWLFAAALPMSAPSDAGITGKGLTPTLSHIPLWIFQGGLDTAPTPSRTQGYVRIFRNAGTIVRYSEYSHLGHGVWNTAYGEYDFFSWMLNKNKANIHLFAGVSAICESNGQGVRMELAQGFFHYEWERDGVTIPDASGATHVANIPGTYRARFSRKQNPGPSDWNRWSDPVVITSNNLDKPEISQRGTVVLKGLDNYAYAHLKAEGNFAHYYWYKDGVLLNLPGSQDDTTRNVRFSAGNCSSGPCSGNGVYTLVVASPDNCASPPSDGKYIFFNNQAPVNIPAPTGFTGSAQPEGGVMLNWNDVSSTENGFEIWRRRQTGTTTYTKWEMVPITNANVTSMTDKGLIPASTYQYKIRAVGNAGRSEYTPAASNQFVTVVTSTDTENPTPPQNLVAQSTGIREIRLQWTGSTDNTGIAEYEITFGSQVIATGTPVTTYTLTDLPLNANYTFTVRARDLGNNYSVPGNEAFASTFVNGLYYEHTTGAFSDIDLIDWSIAEYEGVVNNFTLDPKSQEDYFNFEFEGYLYINNGGSYQFQTYSDDGSRVTINSTLAVDNDGQHGPRTISGQTLNLNEGPHLINVKFFEYTGGQTLVVRYKGPDTGNAWLAIPDAALRSGNNTLAMTALGRMSGGSQSPEPETVKTDDLNTDVYPNPLRPNENITLLVTAGTAQPVGIKLMDTMGKIYYDKIISRDGFTDGIPIAPEGQLGKGMYILIIQQGNKIRKQTIIVKE